MNDEHQDYQNYVYDINKVIFLGLAKTIGGKKGYAFQLGWKSQRVKTPRIPPRCPEAPSTLHIGLRYKSCRKRDGGQVRDCAGDEPL